MAGRELTTWSCSEAFFRVKEMLYSIIVIGAPYPNLWILFMIPAGGLNPLNPHGHLQATELAVNDVLSLLLVIPGYLFMLKSNL